MIATYPPPPIIETQPNLGYALCRLGMQALSLCEYCDLYERIPSQFNKKVIYLKVGGFFAQVVELEGLLRPRVREPATAEVVEVGDKAAKLTPIHSDRVQLVLVLLREGAAKKSRAKLLGTN